MDIKQILNQMKRCVYCKAEIPEKSVIDCCERCGKGVWGDKMFRAIVANMEEAGQRGDLDQGGNGRR